MPKLLCQKIQKSPFRNTYWFARYLINTDQYGSLGKVKEKQLLKIVLTLENIINQTGFTKEDKLAVLKNTLKNDLLSLYLNSSKTQKYVKNLVQTLNEEIKTIDDIIIFCITMKYIVAPINHALSLIPSDDIEFCHKTAKSILETLGDSKVGLVISTWDILGIKGCLNTERVVIIEEFTKLLEHLKELKIEHDKLDDNILLTAFIQEFERRLGQKRKTRGGGSLESVLSFLFDYYNLKSTSTPKHFNQDLEVDKWFKCDDGWIIGISCKRTLRERWKQLSQADRGTLSHFKIKELWHLITYDKDLTDEKIVRLGEQGQVFYLMDESEIYKRCSSHIGMNSYVRPLSQLITDIKKNMTKL